MSDSEKVEELEIELEKKRGRLEEFSSIVSHDLRNPLNLAQGYLELAQESGDEKDFKEVKKSLDRMEEIIEHVLFMARKPEKIEEEEVDLKEVFESAWRDVGPEGGSYNVESHKIKADRASLKEMLKKMISNSLAHNEKDIRIRLGGLEKGFYFEDNGNGIDSGLDQKVFDYGFSTDEEGTGFGLSVVKRIAEAHGWSYEVKDSESGGARFEFIEE